MRGVDISEENLEDLLAYDDLFLDYFNTFLQLPVFPQPLYYNRLTGTFLEVEGPEGSHSAHVARPITPPYGATDEEREKMLEWAKTQRLPVFLRTQLFREFKLCKMLLRPLDDRCSASRGYSRQTESYVSSLSNSADNSANDADFDDDTAGWAEMFGFNRSALYQHRRPGSNAYSLPARLGLGGASSSSSAGPGNNGTMTKETSNVTRTGSQLAGGTTDSTVPRPPSGDPPGNVTSDPSLTRQTTLTTRNDTLVSIEERRSMSGSRSSGSRSSATRSGVSRRSAGSRRSADSQKSGHRMRRRESNTSKTAESHTGGDEVPDYDLLYGEEEPEETGEALVNFSGDAVSDQQTETDVKQLEGKHRMSLQQIKEYVLGHVDGMMGLMNFLKDTAGNNLLHFWLDCEFFKDTMEDYDETQINATRNRLYRDIQDKYKMALSPEARQHMLQAASNVGISHDIFIRTQYDVLRRLRAYWLPRHLIHKERNQELSDELHADGRLMPLEQQLLEREATGFSFFPSINLVNSMPVRADDALHIAQTTNWESVARGGRRLDDRVKSAKPRSRRKATHRTLREKLVVALTSDKSAGGPFKAFLERHKQSELLSSLLLWEDVMEYGMEEDRFADRLLRMCHTWTIYNKYLSPSAPHPVGVSSSESARIHAALQSSRDFVEASLFQGVREMTVEALERAWIRYLKEDLKTFLDCHLRSDDSPPSTAEDIEVILDEVNEQLIVRRPRPWVRRYPPSTDSERGQRLRTALSAAESIDDERRREMRQRAKERRKIMERERKKAIRAARQRQRDAKKQKAVAFKKASGQEGEGGGEAEGEEVEEEEGEVTPELDGVNEAIPEEEEEEKAPSFAESLANKGVMSLFKKYVGETEGKEMMNILSLYLDVEAYHNISDSGKVAKQKRDTQASYIFKTYMEQGARKKVTLSDSVYHRLRGEKERPRSPTLKETQKHILQQLEDCFAAFWTTQAEELGIDQKTMASMSKVDLAMRSDDPALLTGWQKKKGRGGSKSTDRQSTDMSGSSHKVSSTEGSDKGTAPEGHKKKRKPDGRAQPTREDKLDFLVALGNAAAGRLPVQMLYFYKYLVKYSETDANPLIDRDLFFYFEVQKFKDGCHAFADEDLLRKKVQTIMDVYLESSIAPALQIDVPNDIHQRTLRNTQRYLTGKDVTGSIFDDAQYSVFKELLPYWAGFKRSYKTPEDQSKIPLTKRQRERMHRLEEVLSWQAPPSSRVSLPLLPKGASVASFTYSLNDGFKWREAVQERQWGENEEPSNLEGGGGTTASHIGSSLGHRRTSLMRRSACSTQSKRSLGAIKV